MEPVIEREEKVLAFAKEIYLVLIEAGLEGAEEVQDVMRVFRASAKLSRAGAETFFDYFYGPPE